MKDRYLRDALVCSGIVEEKSSTGLIIPLVSVDRIKQLEKQVDALRRYLGVVYDYVPSDFIAIKEN